MGFADEHKELIVPVTVVIVSATFGLFSFLSRPARTSVPMPPPEAVSGDAEPEIPVPPPEPQQNGREQAQQAPEEPSAEQPEPNIAQEYIISDEDSTLYVVQETPLYACPDLDCEIIDTLFPGIYWRLAFTLSPDGWFETGVPQKEIRGYVAVSNLSTRYPNRCSLVLPYRVGHVGSRFIEEGFSREELVAFTLAAERQIEDVVGRNILSYEADAPNTVNFVISHFRDNEPYHRGLHTSTAVFPHGTIGQFWIGIYAALFDDVQEWLDNQYIGPQHVGAFKEHYMKKALLHEMVHTTGFEHIDDPTAVMCGAPDCRPAAVDFTNEQFLSTADKKALTQWCAES